jgi:hypothetical protein
MRPIGQKSRWKLRLTRPNDMYNSADMKWMSWIYLFKLPRFPQQR